MAIPWIDSLPKDADSLRGWLVVLGVFLALFAAMGMLFAVGIMVTPLLHEFKATYAETTLVGTLQLGGYFIGGVVAGPLADRHGVRRVSSVGVVMWIVGMMTSAAATQLWHLYITLGIVVGLGASFIVWPAIAVVPMWFEKYRGTASSMGLVGEGFGNVVMAFGGTKMITEYGWRNSLLVLGGIGAVVLPIFLLLVDRRFPVVVPEKGEGFFTYSIQLMRKDATYRWFTLGCLLFQFSFFLPINLVANWAIDDLGFSIEFAGLAVAMMGIGTCAGRLILGPMGDVFGNYLVFHVCMFLSAVVLIFWNLCGASESTVLAFCFLMMFVAGGFVSQFPVIAADQWTIEKMASAFPMLSVSMIPGALASGPLGGYSRDRTGSYLVIQYVAGGIMFATAFCFFMVKPKKHDVVAAPVPAPAPAPAPDHGASFVFDASKPDLVGGDVERGRVKPAGGDDDDSKTGTDPDVVGPTPSSTPSPASKQLVVV